MSVHVLNYRSSHPDAIDTTSRSKSWSQGLSPFYLGPCQLYNGYVAKNVENAWQYSKVYMEHVDQDSNPTPEYFEWRNKDGVNSEPTVTLWVRAGSHFIHGGMDKS